MLPPEADWKGADKARTANHSGLVIQKQATEVHARFQADWDQFTLH